MRVRIVSFEEPGLVVKRERSDRFTIPYGEILTAERLTGLPRGIRLHTRAAEPVRVACGRDHLAVEHELRRHGVRVVDGYGCIIAPTLAEFEEELMNKPVRVRQSYDDA